MGVITSPDYFYVNGVSSEEVGLYVDTPPVVPMAVQRVTEWSTGLDMDSSSPDDVWENITVSVTAYVFFPESFNLGAVYAFLANARTLQLSRFSGRYLKVVQVSRVQPVQHYDGKKIEINIDFLCSPFKYHTLNETYTMNAQNARLDNPGTRYSRPLYQCNHSTSADSKLSVNGVELTISKDAANPIFIDCERMIAYNGDHENQTIHTNGQFPFLQTGKNLMSVISGSTIYEFYVTGNWRDY